jgi:excisionase family DNA binding protein
MNDLLLTLPVDAQSCRNGPAITKEVMNITDETSPSPVLLTRDDVARHLSTSDRHVRRLIEDGRIPSVRLGGLVRVRVDQLDEFVSDLTSPYQSTDDPDRVAA